MKITLDIINKIFSKKLKLKKKEDIILLSKYDKYIPMFDIYSMKIYPILNTNVHFRMIDCHYRFINQEIFDWMKNIVKKKKENYKVIINNLEILENYNIDILYETSINTFFKYSPKFGLEISICKRNSFHSKMTHITPYYSKKELIKLGSNMNMIDDITSYDLLDQTTHYMICKSISKNDVSIDTILEHSNYIVQKKIINLITFYSLNGSFLMNKLLRENDKINSKYYYPELVTDIKNLIKTVNEAPPLPNDYYFYRFIWEDDFLNKLKVDDIFIDNGFTSTTRDPFYSPGTNYNFGLVLLKINIPKNTKGVGLFIENFSLFPIEEEFLMAPGNKLKLVNRDDNFKYHHINPKFERLVKKKYEFTWIGKDDTIINNINKIPIKNITIPKIDINSKMEGDNFNERIEYIMKNYSRNHHIYIGNYKIMVNWFDGTSSYKDFYYNNNTKGIIFTLKENNMITTSIECGDKMVINYLLKKYYNDNMTKIVMDLYHIIAYIIGYKEFYIYDTFHHYIIKNDIEDIFRLKHKFNNTLKNYIINKKFDDIINGNRIIGSLKMRIIFNKKMEEFNNKYSNKTDMTFGDLYLDMIENNYFYIDKIHNFLMEEHGEELFMTKVDNSKYWLDKDIEFTDYSIIEDKDDIYDTSFNRRRTR